jgi:NADH-quinone oxidoreductase subunit A
LPYLFFAEIILSTKDLLSLTFYHLNDSLFYNEYIVIIIFLFVAIILSVVIILFSYILAVQKPETEKLSTYECGFEPYEDARHTFDVKFYLIAILFIVFDIETMFLIP